MTNINLNIVDGDAFFAHEVTANFTPTQLTLDFKNVTPRSDPRSKDAPSYSLKHNVIMLDPWHAKLLESLLSTVLKQYEGEFGKIKKPQALLVAEKKQKKNATSSKYALKDMSATAPSYVG